MTMARRTAAAHLFSAVLLSAVGGYCVPSAVAQATPTEAAPAGAAPSPPAAAAAPTGPAPATAAPLDPAPGVPAPAAETPAATPPTTTPAATPPAATSPAPADATAATPPAPAATDPATPAATQAQAPPPPPADPIVAAVREKFNDKSFASKAADADRDAAAAFYSARSEGPLWVKSGGGFTTAGEVAIAEVRKADEWGLETSAFTLPAAGTDTAPAALADAEATVTMAVLQYVREARGGRINPQALSPGLDMSPPLKDPKIVLDEITKAGNADGYLRDQHPKHEQFVRLRAALLKLRGPSEPAPVVDEALSVKLPPGKVIKPGAQHADVSLLRRRLKVTAEAGNENLYDAPLQEAVMAFQRANGVKANGFVGQATRLALNGDDAASKPDKGRDVQRIVNNMERWRWLPQDLGATYVWNNIPEFKTRTFKDGKQVYEEKIVVGLPQWATPVFSAQMKTIVFHPEWGVPDGIKQKELMPQLRRAGGGDFFESFFGGGGGGSSRVLQRHDLKVSYNGRQIDPDSVDWNSVDIRRFQFTQPSGPKNVLGIVKFLFPNKHDVYMHDTTAKELFKQNMRAYSHGCMRVNNPVKFAELLLAEDKGWSAAEVDARFTGGANEVKIDKPIWVHTTYFTAVVDDSGKLNTVADVYGYESRVAAALSGKQYRFEAPPEIAEVDPDAPPAATGKRKKQRVTQTDPLTEAISGLFAN